MKGWKITNAKPAAADKLTEIMNEQIAYSLQEKEDPSLLENDTIDEDLLLAQQLQSEFDQEIADCVTTPEDDLIIAQILQANEEEEKRLSKARAKDTAVFEKVGTMSAREFEDSGSSHNQVHSSEWYEAVRLEKKLEKFDGDKQASITKHDPLIRALRSSEQLTEFEGAGDLAGGRLLVSPSVGFTLRSFEKKQRKQRNDISHTQKVGGREKGKITEVKAVVV